MGGAVDGDGAAVGVDDRAGDGQAETGFAVLLTGFITAVEAVEDVGQVCGGDAGAGVGYGEQDILALLNRVRVPGLEDEPWQDVLAVPADFYSSMGLQEVVSALRLRGMGAILARLKRQIRENTESEGGA